MNLGHAIPMGVTGSPGPPGPVGISHEQYVLQQELWEMVDYLFNTQIKTIVSGDKFEKFHIMMSTGIDVDDIRYTVTYDNKFKFVTSKKTGVWGIESADYSDLEVSKIYEIVKSEMRNIKINNILK